MLVVVCMLFEESRGASKRPKVQEVPLRLSSAGAEMDVAVEGQQASVDVNNRRQTGDGGEEVTWTLR